MDSATIKDSSTLKRNTRSYAGKSLCCKLFKKLCPDDKFGEGEHYKQVNEWSQRWQRPLFSVDTAGRIVETRAQRREVTLTLPKKKVELSSHQSFFTGPSYVIKKFSSAELSSESSLSSPEKEEVIKRMSATHAEDSFLESFLDNPVVNPASASLSRLPLTPSKSKRIKWSREEVQGLISGIKIYGIGRWAAIENYIKGIIKGFTRSQTNIKDKWRGLCAKKDPICLEVFKFFKERENEKRMEEEERLLRVSRQRNQTAHIVQ